MRYNFNRSVGAGPNVVYLLNASNIVVLVVLVAPVSNDRRTAERPFRLPSIYGLDSKQTF
jgi:hypothetical protein